MLEILLIEDNPADAEYTAEVLAGWPVEHRLEVAADGEQGLERLLTGDPAGLVLLDLNLPRLAGTDVLRRVREEPSLSGVRVIVLATSDADRDVLESQRLEADGYMSKPINLDELEYLYYRLLLREETR